MTNCKNKTFFEVNLDKVKTYIGDVLWEAIVDFGATLKMTRDSTILKGIFDAFNEHLSKSAIAYFNKIPSLCYEHFIKSGIKLIWNMLEFVSGIFLESMNNIWTSIKNKFTASQEEQTAQANQKKGFFGWIKEKVGNAFNAVKKAVSYVIENPL